MKKYTLKSFQKAAKDIIGKYTGSIPGWKLRINATIESDSEQETIEYYITYKPIDDTNIELDFFGNGHNPDYALKSFESDFHRIFDNRDVVEDIQL